jgi:hypothetical protein
VTIFEFFHAILTLALEFEFSVTSWGRSAKRNKEVGGLDDSFHRSWRAVDAVLDDWGVLPYFRRRAEQLGLQVIREADHLHLEPA